MSTATLDNANPMDSTTAAAIIRAADNAWLRFHIRCCRDYPFAPPPLWNLRMMTKTWQDAVKSEIRRRAMSRSDLRGVARVLRDEHGWTGEWK